MLHLAIVVEGAHTIVKTSIKYQMHSMHKQKRRNTIVELWEKRTKSRKIFHNVVNAFYFVSIAVAFYNIFNKHRHMRKWGTPGLYKEILFSEINKN